MSRRRKSAGFCGGTRRGFDVSLEGDRGEETSRFELMNIRRRAR